MILNDGFEGWFSGAMSFSDAVSHKLMYVLNEVTKYCPSILLCTLGQMREAFGFVVPAPA